MTAEPDSPTLPAPWRVLLLILLSTGLALGLLMLFLTLVARGAPEQELDLGAAQTELGRRFIAPGGMAVVLDARGQALVRLKPPPIDLDAYRFLIVKFAEAPVDATVGGFMKTEARSSDAALFRLPGRELANAVMDVSANEGWSGTLTELVFSFEGDPGERLVLEKLAVAGQGPTHLLGNLFWSWGLPTPPGLTSNNFFRVKYAYLTAIAPVPAVALLYLLTVLLVCLLHRWVLPRGTTALPAVLVVLVLAWLGLDALWLRSQWSSAAVVADTFSGTPLRSRQELDEFQKFALLARSIRERYPLGVEQRVFVASSDELARTKTAYYLLPMNVFWERDRELPPADTLHSRDFVLLIKPTKFRLEAGGKRLRYPGAMNPTVAVEPVFSTPGAVLLEVR